MGAFTLATACPAEEPAQDCGSGQQRPAVDAPCIPAIPPAPCPAGTRAEPGTTTCLHVGPAACGEGFEDDPSGWGCAPVLPATPCAGATRQALGLRECQPLADCDAGFPPTEATLFVDAALPDGSVDATHVRSLSEAIDAATAGAVIAVERGTYREALNFVRDVTVVGRCAAETVLENPGVLAAGLRLSTAAQVAVAGLTVRGHRDGALVTRGKLNLREVVLEANQEAGVVAFRGAVRLDHCVVRGTVPLADGSMGRGLDIESGGDVAVVDSEVAGNADAGLYVSGSGSSLSLQRSVVHDSVASSGTGNGRGLIVRAGAVAIVDDSALLNNRDIGLFIAAATVEMRRSVIGDMQPGPGGYFGQAVELQQSGSARIEDCTLKGNLDRAVVVTGARLELNRSAIVGTASNLQGTQGLGLFVANGADVTAEDVAVADNQAMGVAVVGAATRLTMKRSLIATTRPDAEGAFGHGLAVVEGPQVVLERCELRGNAVTDLIAVSPGARVTVTQSLIHDSRPDTEGRFGFGALAIDGAWLELVDSRIEHHTSVGVGYAEAGGLLTRVAVLSNPVGLNAQGGAQVEEVATLPDSPTAQTVYVTPETVFWNNATRLGSGDLPLPAVPTL
ncbi:MAG: right-handed parallel beta-helix repeat-containing protein [Pseudomonadota bacterium]